MLKCIIFLRERINLNVFLANICILYLIERLLGFRTHILYRKQARRQGFI